MNILIATDGSDCSRTAVEKCCEMLQIGKPSAIKIVSMVESSLALSAERFPMADSFYLKFEADLRTEAEKYVKEAEKILLEKVGDQNVSVQTEVVYGHIKQSIIEQAESFQADLIVVGYRGHGFFERMLLGSFSDFVIHHAPCSVLVVRTES